MINGWLLGHSHVWPSAASDSAMRRCYSSADAPTPLLGDYNVVQMLYRLTDEEHVTVRVQFVDNEQRE